MKDDIIPCIFHLGGPKEFWNILKKLNESMWISKWLLLISTFHKLNMQEILSNFLSNFPIVVKDLFNQIARVGDIIRNEDVMLTV